MCQSYCLLGQVLQFLMDGLKIPQVSTYAANALREMCDKCKKEMTPNFAGLLQVQKIQYVTPYNVCYVSTYI